MGTAATMFVRTCCFSMPSQNGDVRNAFKAGHCLSTHRSSSSSLGPMATPQSVKSIPFTIATDWWRSVPARGVMNDDAYSCLGIEKYGSAYISRYTSMGRMIGIAYLGAVDDEL